MAKDIVLPKQVKDLIGQKFGRLTVIKFGHLAPKPKKGTFWRCQCECGANKIVNGRLLVTGKTRSCGCLRKESAGMTSQKYRKTHGKHNTPIYNIWAGIKERCCNCKSINFHRYGGRGISVCDSWKNSFENFYADMGDPPTPDHSLDRIDNNGDYSPENCRWATRKQQCRNRRSNRMITFQGETKCAAEWADEIGINPKYLCRRLRIGWTPEKALTTPVRQRRKRN